MNRGSSKTPTTLDLVRDGAQLTEFTTKSFCLIFCVTSVQAISIQMRFAYVYLEKIQTQNSTWLSFNLARHKFSLAPLCPATWNRSVCGSCRFLPLAVLDSAPNKSGKRKIAIVFRGQKPSRNRTKPQKQPHSNAQNSWWRPIGSCPKRLQCITSTQCVNAKTPQWGKLFQFDSIDWINAFGLDSMHSAKFMRHRSPCKGTHTVVVVCRAVGPNQSEFANVKVACM